MAFLSKALPDVALELAEGFLKAGRPDLAAQLNSLDLVGRCTCGDDFCATFYTAPDEAWEGRVVERFILEVPGLLCVQVVDGGVSRVEMLYRPDVRERLSEILSVPGART